MQLARTQKTVQKHAYEMKIDKFRLRVAETCLFTVSITTHVFVTLDHISGPPLTLHVTLAQSIVILVLILSGRGQLGTSEGHPEDQKNQSSG